MPRELIKLFNCSCVGSITISASLVARGWPWKLLQIEPERQVPPIIEHCQVESSGVILCVIICSNFWQIFDLCTVFCTVLGLVFLLSSLPDLLCDFLFESRSAHFIYSQKQIFQSKYSRQNDIIAFPEYYHKVSKCPMWRKLIHP